MLSAKFLLSLRFYICYLNTLLANLHKILSNIKSMDVKVLAWSLSFLLFLASTGCAKKSRDVIVELNSGKKLALPYNQTLLTSFISEPPTLDWVRASDMDSALLAENIMMGLTSFDLKDPELKLQPSLATNWTPEKNGKKWTLSLRKGVKWSDGKEFVAKHVVDGWRYLLNPKTASPYASFLYVIKNAKKYNQSRNF